MVLCLKFYNVFGDKFPAQNSRMLAGCKVLFVKILQKSFVFLQKNPQLRKQQKGNIFAIHRPLERFHGLSTWISQGGSSFQDIASPDPNGVK